MVAVAQVAVAPGEAAVAAVAAAQAAVRGRPIWKI